MQHHEKAPEKEIRNVVLMSALSSAEHLVRKGAPPQRILSDIYLRVDRGQVWGITARTGLEIRLLLEIMGNIRPYDGGRCVLAERGMMRRKRVILPHVFYIGDTDMLYGNMNVLEYLMFATVKRCEDRLEMQEELFELLIDIGLGNISLSAVRWLSAEEKAVVALIAAAYSDSVMVIFNQPEMPFDERLRHAVAKTAELMARHGKALIIGTRDCDLIQKACNHTAFIAQGRILYQGTTDYLRQHFDKTVIIIDDPDTDGLMRQLEPVLDGCKLTEKNGGLYVKAAGDAGSPGRIYRKIIETGVTPQCMRINGKTVGNAYEELMQRHDLPEQLF